MDEIRFTEGETVVVDMVETELEIPDPVYATFSVQTSLDNWVVQA